MDKHAITSGAAAPSTLEPAEPSRPEIRPAIGQPFTAGGSKEGASPRRRHRRESENPWRAEILARLEKPGCFMCREAVDNIQRYYFWFLVEQYANIPTMDQLQRAHGFCLRHTRHLVERGVPDRISYIASYVLRSCADWLRAVQAAASPEGQGSRADRKPASGPFGPAAGCPACEQERANVQLYAEVIVGCLEDADIVRAFRASDGLCLPHFLAAAHVAGWATLRCLAEEQIRRLDGARATLSAFQTRGTDGALSDALREAWGRLYGPDLDKSIRPFLVAGRRPQEASAAFGRGGVTPEAGVSATWSPAFEETCRLLSQPGCSLCRVTARGREEYLAWLEGEIRDFTHHGYRWNQTLYLCSQHAWLFADRCAPEVLAAACDRLLDQSAGILRHLLWEIREPIPPSLVGRIRALPARWRESSQPESRTRSQPPSSQRARSTLRTLWLTPQKFLDRVRERILRRDPCPLCRHLDTIEARAADRLLAVLADAEGRQAFERSYGLCLRHAPLLLERAGTPGLRREIAAMLLARIAVDRWEVEEYLRKQSWSVRHEPKGAEREAWLRASTRLAGVAMEQHYGF